LLKDGIGASIAIGPGGVVVAADNLTASRRILGAAKGNGVTKRPRGHIGLVGGLGPIGRRLGSESKIRGEIETTIVRRTTAFWTFRTRRTAFRWALRPLRGFARIDRLIPAAAWYAANSH
jgi:hypothetical protein